VIKNCLVLAACVGLLTFLALPFPHVNGAGAGKYQVVADWLKVPTDIKLGPVSAVAHDSADRLYVFHRGKRPILVFDKDGRFLRSWGDEQIKFAHGLRLDADENVWVTDIAFHQVIKYDREGKVLMTLGTKGEKGDGNGQFNKPTDVAVARSGDIYVSDGYGNSRVVKFSKDGKFIKTWGKKGKGPGEFNLPHAICLDAKGQVCVGDRENSRVQIFDPEGTFVAEWKEGGSPYGLLVAGTRMFVVDGVRSHVTVLDAAGKAVGGWGDRGKEPGQFATPHWASIDSKGAIYIAEVENARVQKFVAK
jgi:hypothetical protein